MSDEADQPPLPNGLSELAHYECLLCRARLSVPINGSLPDSSETCELHQWEETDIVQAVKKDAVVHARMSKRNRRKGIQLAYELLIKGHADNVVTKSVMSICGVKKGSAKRCIDAARARMVADLDIAHGGKKPREVLVAEVYHNYKRIAFDFEKRTKITEKIDEMGNTHVTKVIELATDARTQVFATQCIANLLGLNAPIKVANTDITGTKESGVELLRQAALKDPETREALIIASERLAGLVLPQIAGPEPVDAEFVVKDTNGKTCSNGSQEEAH